MEFTEAVMGKVKDGYMSELPEDLQKKIIEANKIIVAEVNSLIKEDRYQDLHNSRWAMSCIDDFCTKPSPKDDVGSFRLYQKKKSYECMIQCTGHFKNFQYGWIEDLLNSFIKDLFFKVRPTIRKKLDMTLKSEGDNGNPEEGFDIYPSKKEAEELWNKFEDKKIKSLKESTDDIYQRYLDAYNDYYNTRGSYIYPIIENVYSIANKIRESMNLPENILYKYNKQNIHFGGSFSYDHIQIGLFDLYNTYIYIGKSEDDARNLGDMTWFNDELKKFVSCIETELDNYWKNNNIIGQIENDYTELMIWKYNESDLFTVVPGLKEKQELFYKLEDEYYNGSSNFMNEEIEGYTEMSHGKLKYSFRLAINKDNGHIVKIVFDLDPNKITLMGSHDDTNPIPDDKQDELAKNIRKTGFTDFASVGKVLAIVDMDTKEKLKTVNTVGIMNGNHEWAEKPLKERENDMKNGTKFYGSKTFTVGEVEGSQNKRFNQGSYKTTKAPKNAHDLRNVVNGHRKGRGYVKESEEFTEGIFDIFKSKKKFTCGKVAFSNLPEGLRNLCKDTNANIRQEFLTCAKELGLDTKEYVISDSDPNISYSMNMIADVIAGKYDDGVYIYDTSIVRIGDRHVGYTDITIPLSTFIEYYWQHPEGKEIANDIKSIINAIYNKLAASFTTSNPGKSLFIVKGGLLSDADPSCYINIHYDEKYTEKLINFINDPKNYPLTEATSKDKDDEESIPSYNTEMSEKEAKKTLRSLSQTIINNYEDTEQGKGKNKVSQYTANIYANIITKNLLPTWAPSFKRFSITLDTYQSFNTVEFKTPAMSQDFISRYVDGKEPLNAFLHRVPEIKLKISPRVFHTMKNPDDAFNFFKAAIQYYDHNVERYSKSLMGEVFKLNHNMKHLIGTTKLSSLVTVPMKLLFVFEDVHMDNKNTFKISSEDISAISKFVRNIYTSYAAPEKEKKKIVDDMRSIVKELREKCEVDDDFKYFSYLPEAVESFLFGKYDSEFKLSDTKWISENVDIEGMKEADFKTSALYEKFGVKKLKKIPSDLIAYITIEAESIKDANDKMMIASYCCSKIEIVEWYIELLEVGSKKYIVPHTKPYLETVRTQLLACYKKIMNTPIPKQDRAIIAVNYPKGYEG